MNTEDHFKKYSKWHPKDKFDYIAKRFDWYDMINFATYCTNNRQCMYCEKKLMPNEAIIICKDCAI